MCNPCKARVARYNRARYEGEPKPWPAKRLCLKCRVSLRAARVRWRKTYVAAHRPQINAYQREYRKRMKGIPRAVRVG